jgi:peptide deformylase
MAVTIVQKDNPILRGKAAPVPLADIQSKKIKKIIKDMTEALDGELDGVAIAAPQIAVPFRIVVISKRAFQIESKRKKLTKASSLPSDTTADANSEQTLGSSNNEQDNLVLINPEIIKLSKEKRWMAEGCLSVRYLYGKIQRSTRATVRAYDEKGQVFERGGSGLLAQIFQHEVDHLNGTLFIDSAKDIEDLPPEQTSHTSSETNT